MPQRLDVAGFIVYVLDVDVDHPQTNLCQLHFHRFHNGRLELFPVLVDFLDVHRRYGGTELTEDDILGNLAHILLA